MRYWQGNLICGLKEVLGENFLVEASLLVIFSESFDRKMPFESNWVYFIAVKGEMVCIITDSSVTTPIFNIIGDNESRRYFSVFFVQRLILQWRLTWKVVLQISGTALVLDEIINHVQSLQRQVEVRLAHFNNQSLYSSSSYIFLWG